MKLFACLHHVIISSSTHTFPIFSMHTHNACKREWFTLYYNVIRTPREQGLITLFLVATYRLNGEYFRLQMTSVFDITITQKSGLSFSKWHNVLYFIWVLNYDLNQQEGISKNGCFIGDRKIPQQFCNTIQYASQFLKNGSNCLIFLMGTRAKRPTNKSFMNYVLKKSTKSGNCTYSE